MTIRERLERELDRDLMALRDGQADDPKRREIEAVLSELRAGTVSDRVLEAVRRLNKQGV